MSHIKSLKIQGFKKFAGLQVDFNEKMNILVGENEAGKSTILEAIKIVINQQYKNADKAVLMDLFNVDQINKFKENPSIETLPSIVIELEFVLDVKDPTLSVFYGEENSQPMPTARYGITFECKYDDSIDPTIEEVIKNKEIPCEYYSLTWKTFANRSYQAVKKPFNLLVIDTSSSSVSPSFNYYNRTLFTSKYDNLTRLRVKNDFRAKLEAAFRDLNLKKIDNDREFGIDHKKLILESAISVFEGAISLENRGSGMENLIKTKIALEKENNVDVILIEEPETHLSISNLKKMLGEIESEKGDSQIILTTHNNLIASGLRLSNVLWIGNDSVKNLNYLDKEVVDFFCKADHNSFLELLLSEKVFIVEGAAEYILLPWLYKLKTRRTMEEDGISMISGRGVTYKKYLSLAKGLNKKLAVLTDNDGYEKRIREVQEANDRDENHQIFMPTDISESTFEIALYNINREKIDENITNFDDSKYIYKGKNVGKVLYAVLEDKAQAAYILASREVDLKIPVYIDKAIEWLRK